ncbi:hypothetical protein [Paraburkholderia sp. MM5477-R1]|uniref:hypothetical protein n=1 Tax=Paraburkholderia sp. MM5477-R1 TaxID=2991062 RepID=UPI003D1A34B2
MKLIAIRRFGYAGRDRKPGDEFDAKDSDARVLIATKAAKAATASPSSKPGTTPRDVRAEGGDSNGDAKPKKGRYRRRDQRADDDTTGA